MSGKLIVVSGPSGVGKSSVVNWVKSHTADVWVSVSMTTRAKRPDEVDGREYFFVTPEKFKSTVDSGQMLEWAEFAGNLYGTPAAPVKSKIDAGSNVILEIELQGARQIRRIFPSAILVFLKAPSWQVLVERLTGRGTESQEVIENRLAVAKIELAAESEFDISLINEDVETTGRELLDFARS